MHTSCWPVVLLVISAGCSAGLEAEVEQARAEAEVARADAEAAKAEALEEKKRAEEAVLKEAAAREDALVAQKRAEEAAVAERKAKEDAITARDEAVAALRKGEAETKPQRSLIDVLRPGQEVVVTAGGDPHTGGTDAMWKSEGLFVIRISTPKESEAARAMWDKYDALGRRMDELSGKGPEEREQAEALDRERVSLLQEHYGTRGSSPVRIVETGRDFIAYVRERPAEARGVTYIPRERIWSVEGPDDEGERVQE